MPDQLIPQPDQKLSLAAYEAQLRAMPSYELKAEYIIQFGHTWDDLPRPKLEHAIEALLNSRRM
jgi:hypothetical protein